MSRKQQHQAKKQRSRSGQSDNRKPSKPKRFGDDKKSLIKKESSKARQKQQVTTLKAIVDKNQKGFGFLIFEGKKFEDAFLPPREAEMLFHGDRVEVKVDSSGRPLELRVIEHRFKEIVGRYLPHPVQQGKSGWLVYERKRAREEVFIPDLFPQGIKELKAGDWILAKLHFHERGPYTVTAQILKVYGKDLPPSADIEMVASEFNLTEHHSKAAEEEANRFGKQLTETDFKGREDFRSVPFITIDGETARDFDDAVFVERKKSGFVLWVAIADVSYYVREGSHLDKDARSRATSVYFPERAFHMLPGTLSENLCSLRPNEPRLSLVARIEFDRNGNRSGTTVYEGVIESKRRATYTEIQNEWNENQKNPDWQYASHFALFQLLRKMRSGRGSLDFELPEAEMRVEPNGEVISIRNRARLDSHRLIEEFMIAANEAVTDWVMNRSWPFVYRIHDEPALKSLEKFESMAATLGIKLSLEGGSSPGAIADVLRRLEGHPAQSLLNMMLLRSMKQAIYSSTHGIHFGLASPGYTHFTSPIRRYPDLVVHRIIRMILNAETENRPLKQRTRERLEEELAEICEHCSFRERLAADAERESIKVKQVRLMSRHLGDEYDSKVVGMVASGLFVQVDNPFVEGMVSVDSMVDDFYEFNEDKMSFQGRRKKKIFRIGDSIKVRVVRTDLDRRQIDFVMIN